MSIAIRDAGPRPAAFGARSEQAATLPRRCSSGVRVALMSLAVAYGRPMILTRALAVLAAALVCAAVPAASSADPRQLDIVGGSPAPAAGSWPSISYLRGAYHGSQSSEHQFACTGSVVAPQWIVTAAHCTFGKGHDAPERMVATLGVTDFSDPAGEHIAVDRFVPYPSYDSRSGIGDVGLLHLAAPTSRPAIPLATAAAAGAGGYLSPPGVPNAAGWGAVDQDGTQLTKQLQQAYLQVRAPADCSALISSFDPATQTCAGTQGTAGACLGDSGGPLVEFDAATGQPALWGLTSYGTQSGEGLATCSLELPAVYTWIPAYTQFIQSTIGSSAAVAGTAPATERVSDPSSRTRTTACRKALVAVTAARKRERAALRRLRAARRRGMGATSPTLAMRRYRTAKARRRHAVATAERRCGR